VKHRARNRSIPITQLLVAPMTVLLAVLLLAACTRSSSPSTLTPSGAASATATSSPFPSLALPSGIYVDGPRGTPHYFVALTVEPGGASRGTVAYLYQDGQTSAVFTFTATSQSGVATVTTSTGALITATYGKKQLTLGECPSYLPLARSMADCTFRFSPHGLS
jgi:hypothetical protein